MLGRVAALDASSPALLTALPNPSSDFADYAATEREKATSPAAYASMDAEMAASRARAAALGDKALSPAGARADAHAGIAAQAPAPSWADRRALAQGAHSQQTGVTFLSFACRVLERARGWLPRLARMLLPGCFSQVDVTCPCNMSM